MKNKILSLALGGALILTALFGVNFVTTGSSAPEASAATCGTSFPYDLCNGWTFFGGTGQSALEFRVNAVCTNLNTETVFRWDGSQWTANVPNGWILEPSQAYWVYC